MGDVYVVSCCRTAIGSFMGSLAGVPAAELGATVVRAALERGHVAADAVDELDFGCVLTAAAGQNVARQVGIGAGLPLEVPASTVGMVCGSGMRSVIDGARAIRSGDADVVVTGGAESMSQAPYAAPAMRGGARMFDATMVDTMVHDALWDAFNDCHMGTTAENVCDLWGITREELDAFAARSQQRAEAAQEAGRFEEEIVPVSVRRRRETLEFKVDEFPRPGTTAASIARLRPCFAVGGAEAVDAVEQTFEPTRVHEGDAHAFEPRVTAANSSGINDGAAAVVLASGEAVRRFGITPMARLVSWGMGGVDPKVMGVGPVPAVRQALARAGLGVGDMDLVEANEAFAAQSIAVARELGLDMDRVNVNGGAIALGHPVGASGARIVVTLLHELHRREGRYGLATLCVGGGMGVATVYERC